MPLRNRLKEYRARLGVNQQQMGALVGTSRQTISQIERGDYSPSVTLALKIAKVCGVSVEDIFLYEEDELYDRRGGGYSIVYDNFTIEQITEGKYSYNPKSSKKLWKSYKK